MAYIQYSKQSGLGEWKPHINFDDVLKGILDDVGDISKLDDEQLKRLAEKKQELLRHERSSPIHYYRPYESALIKGRYPQDEFHRSLAKIRLFIGGNRSGKSQAGAVEAVWMALGIHPYYKCRIPNKGWIVSLDFPMSRDVAEAKIRELFPASDIIRWDQVQRVMYHKYGEIRFRSCDQDLQTFGGSAIDWVWIDEEPVGIKGQAIWQELLMRTIDKKGRLWFTLTPVSGMSWSFDTLYEAAANNKDIHITEVQSYENSHIDRGELDTIAKNLSAEELDMRLKGKYIQFSGLIYKEFNKAIHVIPGFPIPKDWKKFRGIDHGINHPTACIFMAVNPKGEIYVYDEYYQSNKTIRENCEAITQITAGEKIEWTMIDPSTDARDPQTGKSDRRVYRDCGIVTRAMRTERMYGVNLIQQLLLPNPVTGRPRLFIFDSCPNLIKEFQRYRWKSYRGSSDNGAIDQPVKVLDDALDALRYAIVSNPRYDLYDDFAQEEPVVWYK